MIKKMIPLLTCILTISAEDKAKPVPAPTRPLEIEFFDNLTAYKKGMPTKAIKIMVSDNTVFSDLQEQMRKEFGPGHLLIGLDGVADVTSKPSYMNIPYGQTIGERAIERHWKERGMALIGADFFPAPVVRELFNEYS